MNIPTIRGFTIVELLVVITMLSILTGLVAFNGVESRHVAALNLAAEQVKSTVYHAQTLGRGGLVAPGAVTERFDRGFGVLFRKTPPDNTKLVIYNGAGTDPNNPSDDRLGSVYETQALASGVSIDGICLKNGGACGGGNFNKPEAYVLFRRGQPNASIRGATGDNQNYAFTKIRLEAGGYEKIVTVYNTGLVEIE